MRVTLKDIAKKAGVSRPAVSMVLNNPGTTHLNEAKKQEVLRLAREMGYRPNYSALQLRGKSTRVIGVIGSVFSVPVHTAIINSIMQCFRLHGYNVLLGDHGGDFKLEKEIAAEFESRGVDGIILFNATSPKMRQLIKVPQVAVSHNQQIYDICTDLQMGGLIAGRHLIGHGHRKIGFVGHAEGSGPLRRQGLADALAECGVEFNPAWYLQASTDTFSAKLKRAYSSGVTAFFTLNDFLGGYVLSELKRLGIGDAAVIGFDGLRFADYFSPPLTTVTQPVRELGEETVKLMLRRLGGEEPDGEILRLPPRLHIGGSCGCPYTPHYSENQSIY